MHHLKGSDEGTNIPITTWSTLGPAPPTPNTFSDGGLTHPTIPKSEGLRSQEWKYFRYYEQDPIYECLYNLQIDPNETTNLAADPEHEDQLNLMRVRCDQLISEAQAGSP